jgi:myosin heavy subunit
MAAAAVKDDWVLTHSVQEIFPFRVRREWQNATKKVISALRLRKIKKEVFKARALAYQMKLALEEVAQCADRKINGLQTASTRDQRRLRFIERKHLAFKTTMRELHMDLQERNKQLKTVVDRNELHALQFQSNLKELHEQKVSNDELMNQIRLKEKALKRLQEQDDLINQLQLKEKALKRLQDQLDIAYDALNANYDELSANQTKLRAASQDLVASQGERSSLQSDVQSLKQQLDTEQTARADSEQVLHQQFEDAQVAYTTTLQKREAALKAAQEQLNAQGALEQTLRFQLEAAKQVHVSDTKNLLEGKAAVQAAQHQLQREQAARTASDNQHYQEQLVAQGTLRGLEATVQTLRGRLAATDALYLTTNQKYYTSQHELSKEKATMAGRERALRTELAKQVDAVLTSEKKFKALSDDLNTCKGHFQTTQKQLAVEQAARERYHTLKSWIITHYDAQYKQATQRDEKSVHAACVLHLAVNGLAPGTPLQHNKLCDKANFTIMFNNQFAS